MLADWMLRLRSLFKRSSVEKELDEELALHFELLVESHVQKGATRDEAVRRARLEFGTLDLAKEEHRDARGLALVDDLARDLRYALRQLRRSPGFTLMVVLSLGLGIGANTAIYSFMDGILLRSLPVSDPESLVVVKWRCKPFVRTANGIEFVMHSMDGRTYSDRTGVVSAIYPFAAVQLLEDASAPVLSSLFAHKRTGNLNVLVRGEAEIVQGEYVSGNFFSGLAVLPAAGRMIHPADDRADAASVVVVSTGWASRRYGDPASAVGQVILVNNLPFTIVGITPREFFGVDPGAAPQLYLPMQAGLSLQPDDESKFVDPNYYWVEMMGRLRPGVARAQAETALALPFARWVAPTAKNDAERDNLPELWLDEGASGLDSLRRQYSQPLYVLLAMVALILAIACANTANLLLSRAAARRREMAVRLGLGASRLRVVRQLLTESLLLASLGGALGVLMAVAGISVLTRLLANGQEGFTLRAELNGPVLAVTLLLSLLCGVLFGLAPALQATGPALMPMLRERPVGEPRARLRDTVLRLSTTQVLVVAQMAISLLLLVGAGLFVSTLSNLQKIALGFNRESVVQFEVDAPKAGYPAPRVVDFYSDLQRRLSAVPGVVDVSLSHASLVRAGRGHPVTVGGQPTQRTRILYTGPRFFTTMQIPIARGRELVDSDRQGTLRVAVVSDLFARTNFGDDDPIGRRLEVGGGMNVDGKPTVFEIVGIAAPTRYGPLRREVPPVVYLPYLQLPAERQGSMVYALRTLGDPLRYASTVRSVVHDADSRVPVNDLKTLAADIDQTINQEIVFARLCTAFAILALTIACVGLYATMAYAVARRTREIGLRMALGAGRGEVVWMVLRDVCLLAAVGLSIGVPVALGSSRLVESLLFKTKPNDPRTLVAAVTILLTAALAAGYGPARRASRVDPMVALRHE
jgi:predicted permease